MITDQWDFRISVELDKFNKNHIRNVHNVKKDYYNCGGYALETFNWYLPPYQEKNGHPINYKKAHKKIVKSILKEFPDLRIIKNVHELRKKEYAIAFRTATSDFHFIKMARNGHWFEKMGDSSCINQVSRSYVFSESWNCGYYDYDSPLTLFAKKRD